MGSMNPILAELDGLSPSAKQALLQAHQGASNPMQGTQAPNPAMAALRSPAAPAGPEPPAPTIPPIGGGQSVPAIGASHPTVIAPKGTLTGDQAERSRLMSTGSGESQIYNKVTNSGFGQEHPMVGKILGGLGQGAAMIGDAAVSSVLPQLTRAIPGTESHHQALLHSANNAVAGDENNAEKEAQTRNLDMAPELKQAQSALNQSKQDEVENHHKSQIDAQLRQHGFKADEEGNINPLGYDEMSPEQQSVHDLKASQEELANARKDLVKAQKDNIPAAQKMAQQRIQNAQNSASIAAERLGLSKKEFLANFYGTDENGLALPGAPADAAGNPVGAKMASITKPGATASGRASQGKAINIAAKNLQNEIDANKDLMGNLGSYWNQAVNGSPITDPRAAKLMTEFGSFAALQPALHGFRSHEALKEFAKMIGGIPNNPEAAKAAIQGIVEGAANPMIEAGSVQTVKPHGSGPQAGMVEGGFRFKGGDPGKQENWEKVQ